LPAGKKVVLVLDQFEQWLHAQREGTNPALVQALRQCDGQHVQCLLLVRDDFWMATTRFMRDLEIRLVEGDNSTAVDLFEPRHARKVLAAFGRAFGALPQGAATPEQERFLDEAVAGLAREGTVIPVRLSLFAEMIKGKPWTPATLQQVGGTEGIGVTFLEGTFSATTAPPEHRLHQRAARAVLKALLPEHGSDIKGHLRSQQELLDASGYARRPQEFGELLRILDTELRLITPTDPEGIEAEDREVKSEEREAPAGDPQASGGQYYQLTHDYLVPALRQWLTRKQRETRRGRMQLLLAERAALWSAKQESQQLPGWWEWANLLIHTRHKDRTALERRMLSAATRRHLLQAGVLLLLLSVFGWALVEVYRGPLKAATLVHELASADTSQVSRIIGELASRRRWAESDLRGLANAPSLSRKQRLHVSLALLPWDPDQKSYLYERMLEADPDEFPYISNTLREQGHAEALVTQLRELMQTETNSDRRFRAACALASYDPRNPDWEHWATLITDKLVKLNSQEEAEKWNVIVTYSGVANDIQGSLSRILTESDRPESERLRAATMLVFYAFQSIEGRMTAMMLDTEGTVYQQLLVNFLADQRHSADVFRAELDKKLRPDAPENDTKRYAHAAVVVLQQDQWNEYTWPLSPQAERIIWPMLRQGRDPRLRSYLIHRLSSVSLNPDTLLKQYQAEQDVVAKRALLLSLGEFPVFKLPARRPQPLMDDLLHTYRNHPDRGLHAALDWLLRQQWKLGVDLQRIDRELAEQQPGAKEWYVNHQEQTLVTFRSPGDFEMGSPADEPDRQEDETRHLTRIPRSFALATKEVTVEQFQRFLKDHRDPAVAARWAKTLEKCDPETPVVGVTWFEAAQYCRWLSEQEGIPEGQRCYPLIQDIKPGMQMPADYLARTGYRLPTEAEWEYACRAGAATSRPYGVAEELLGDYAWYLSNSRNRTWPVGSKKPNDHGLFDMLGNAWEWCQDAYAPYPQGPGGQMVEDREDKQPITAVQDRVLRGGGFVSGAGEARSAARFKFPPQAPYPLAGLRVARTYP
jgi:formylglycine-generating enzyme required for sulfatase activity